MYLSCYLTRFAGPHVVRFSAVEVYVSSWTGRCRMVTLAHKGSICTTQIHHAFVFSLYIFMSLCFFCLLSLYAQHKLTLNDDEMFLGDRSLTALAAPDHILREQWPYDRLLYLALAKLARLPMVKRRELS